MASKIALIIDDDSANRSIWELVLSEKGYEVYAAPDLATAEAYLDKEVTLYLIDYHLPDGHGTDLIGRIRDKRPASVVVMVSMDDDADVIRETIQAGGNVFMVKPTSPSTMTQIISEIEAGDLNSHARQLISRHGRRSYA